MSNDTERRKLCISSLVLGIVGAVFALFAPIATYACSIPGLISGVRGQKKNYRAAAGIVLNIVALSLALINSVLGIIMTIKIFFSDDKENE